MKSSVGITLVLLLWLSACAATPPKPTSYEGAPRVPINKAVTINPAPPS